MTETDAWTELLKLSIAIRDPRADRGKRHKLTDVLFLVVAGLLAGCEDAEAIVDFGEDHRDWLDGFLSLEHGLPAHDTILRVLAMLPPATIESLIRAWLASIVASGLLAPDGAHVAVDGKAMRGSADRRSGASPVHMVSAYLTEAGFTLGCERVDDKSNEIRAIPILLRSLHLRGATVTIDAMGCQREIAACIRDAGADYVLQVKGNQPALLADIEFLGKELVRRRRPGEARAEVDRYRNVDKGHGRIETRVCVVSHDLDWIQSRGRWPGLSGVAFMWREREDVISGKRTQELSYYILSNGTATARTVSKLIRNHWAIENVSHWSLDVVWGEDGHQLRERVAAENLSRLRRFTAGLIRAAVGERMSGRRLLAKCNRNPRLTLQVLRGEKVSRAAKRRPNRPKDRPPIGKAVRRNALKRGDSDGI